MKSTLHTDQFTFDKGLKSFTAEASDLGFKPGFIPIEITLTSGRTGKNALFTLEHIEEDGSLKFEASGPTLRTMGVKIHIIND